MSYYSQHTPGYKAIKLGTCNDSLWQSGCFLTSFCNIGKELEWFDYTPVAMNKIFIKEKLFSNGCLLVCPTVAKHFGLTYEKVTKDPGILCIAETNKYAPSVPQHFFAYEKGMILDPLDPDPKWNKNPYPLVSFRVFKKYKDQGISTSIPVMGETTTTAVPVQNAPNGPKIDAGEAKAPEGGTGTPQPEIADSVAPKKMTILERLKQAIINWLKSIKERS